MKNRRSLIDEEYFGNPYQDIGVPPELFNREASLDDPWDASNEPDAFSPAEMIRPDAEDVSAEDGVDLDAWLGRASGSVDGSRIAPLPEASFDGSRIAPLDDPSWPTPTRQPDASFDHIPAYADQLVDEARAAQAGGAGDSFDKIPGLADKLIEEARARQRQGKR